MSRPSVRGEEPEDSNTENYQELIVDNLTEEGSLEALEDDYVPPDTISPVRYSLQHDFFEQPHKEEKFGDITGMEDDETRTISSGETSQERVKMVSINVEEIDDETVDEEDDSYSPRLSTYSDSSKIRPSINYDVRRRLVSTVEEDMEKLFSLKQPDNIILFDDTQESEEAESEATIVEEEQEHFDRTPYYEQYDKLVDESDFNRPKNNLLQKLIIMYLKRRKTENILKDLEPPMDQTMKYGQKLDAYREMMDINVEQRASVAEDVETLRQKRNLKIQDIKHILKMMQNRESNVGHGLIYAKTGSQISDKLVDRLLKRQTTLIEQVSSMRLSFIKLRDLVQEKIEKITKLDTLENNLLLADYEQLKVENRSHADKLEERDEELARLRTKCTNTIQILAHVREKSFALEADLQEERESFSDVDYKIRDQRETLAYLKHTRDEYRQMTRKLKDSSGLLLKPALLIDMEESQEEFLSLEEEIIECKQDVDIKKSRVRKLRRLIEVLKQAKKAGEFKKIECYKKLIKQKSLTSSSNTSKEPSVKSEPAIGKFKLTGIYKTRPTMYIPIFEEDAFDGILKIRPHPKVFNRKK
ncbi:unnamed protein product [Ceutorhynchus assimilis]|uniref:CCDC113/CCDC96 coiled-coil domain-containing protein n=1 Tax=Ceutorhynchus assimilis TaxID=467358 RepID=A0A9N9ME77_9CUCU|nr:unnamed protein product [Ceutorhynchus assimilis]